MKMARKTKKMTGMKGMDMMSMACCYSWFGIIHILIGIGIGFLVVTYFGLGNLPMWGWLLVGVGVVAHFFGKM
jgi:hypothetical protein